MTTTKSAVEALEPIMTSRRAPHPVHRDSSSYTILTLFPPLLTLFTCRTLIYSASQPEKTTSTLSYLSSLIPSPGRPDPEALIGFAEYLLTDPSVPLVVGRQVVEYFVLFLCGGSGVDFSLIRPAGAGAGGTVEVEDEAGIEDISGDEPPSSTSTSKSNNKSDPNAPENILNAEELEWLNRGAKAFSGEEGAETRETVVSRLVGRSGGGSGSGGSQAGGWGDDQMINLKYLYSHIQETQEEWEAAALTLSSIPLDSGNRSVSDLHKLAVYIKIVRLYLEAGESGLAQSTFGRAALLIHLTEDKATQLAYKLCQARLLDFSRRFNEAASRYHELSFIPEIDEEERIFMLSAAVTCAILGPAGPQRSRILANLYRDDRTSTALPPHRSSILRKMFLDQILRVQEIQEFEKELAEHQLATLEVDKRLMASTEGEEGVTGRRAPTNVLDRAVMEHNVLACAKVYDNIRFDGLGALLDLTPNAAEAMARTMIEQKRLRAWIDQVDRLIYFEGRSNQDQDDLQGTAGGLGVEHVEKPIEGISLTERWDERIKETATKVEFIVNLIQSKGLLASNGQAPMKVD